MLRGEVKEASSTAPQAVFLILFFLFFFWFFRCVQLNSVQVPGGSGSHLGHVVQTAGGWGFLHDGCTLLAVATAR